MIHIHSIVWNAEYILPYFLRHYTKFAKVFIIDDHSTDRTTDIARELGATVLEYPHRKEFHDEKDHSNTFVESYKKHSRDADWVMCVDQDEFIYEPNLKGLSGVVKPQAYMMISETMPTGGGQIYDEVKTGIRTPKFDKPVIFDPKLDVTFGDGRHTIQGAEPVESDIKLLHYKYLSRDYYIDNSKLLYPRWGMDDAMMEYRINRGLQWYDRHIGAKEVI